MSDATKVFDHPTEFAVGALVAFAAARFHVPNRTAQALVERLLNRAMEERISDAIKTAARLSAEENSTSPPPGHRRTAAYAGGVFGWPRGYEHDIKWRAFLTEFSEKLAQSTAPRT